MLFREIFAAVWIKRNSYEHCVSQMQSLNVNSGQYI